MSDKKFEAFISAVSTGHMEDIRSLYQPEFLLQRHGWIQWTPVHYAAENGNINVLQWLIDCGACPEDEDVDLQRPLHIACYVGNLSAVHWLVSTACCSIDARDLNRRTAIDVALENGHEGCMTMLKKEQLSMTPLHFSERNGYLEVTKMLLDCGADVNAEDADKMTCLHYAAKGGHLKTIMILLDKGSNVNNVDRNNRTPLHYAACHGHDTVVKFLVQQSANVNAADENKKTSMHFAAQNGHISTIQMLLDRGIQADQLDKSLWTPMHYAAQNGHIEVMQLLKDRGASIEAVDLLKQKPLHVACVNGFEAIVRWLVNEAGCSVNVVDWNGRTPLDISRQYGMNGCLAILLEAEEESSSDILPTAEKQ